MDLAHDQPSRDGGKPRVGARLLTWWPAKMAGTMLGLAAFFAAYFWVLRHPQSPVTTMPVTVIDRVIGFQPGALVLYLSLWLYVSLVPALLIVRRELIAYTLAAVGLSVIGLAIFLVWPTTVSRPEVDWTQHPPFAFLATVDAAGNACPSLHVAFAVFSAVWFERLLREMSANRAVRALNWLWCAAILYSTIATRQHVALDVLAGAGLGGMVGAANLRLLRALPGRPGVQPETQVTSCSGPGTTQR
jgi:membrane-associated phospholipid phosphatase